MSSCESLSQELQTLFAFIDQNSEQFIDLLAKAVKIKSISAQKDTRDDTIFMVKWFEQQLQTRGLTTELVDIGSEQWPDGQTLPLPPVLLAQLGNDPTKKTLCVYGHLDVQPADIADGWNTDPFVLIELDGKLYGRGATDDKGPVMAWINIIDAYQSTGIDLPINLKFIFEGMEESGSVGLNELIIAKGSTFLANVDYICISDNYWLGNTKPCLTYGLRGNAYFFVEVKCAAKDLHSGVYGGSVHEAMTDLLALMSKLVDNKGNILIPGVLDDVLPLTASEEAMYESIDFNHHSYREEIGTKRLLFETKSEILAHRWRYPSLSIHGIEGAFSGAGAKTVIPRKVIGKFSIRLVPNQNPDKVGQQVIQYLENEFAKLDSPNRLSVIRRKASKPWIANTDNDNFKAAKLAISSVFGVEPDLTREGGSIPVTLTFEEVTGKSVILLPIGGCDDGAHSQNEKIDRKNYIEGTKVLASYIFHLSKN
ncbi:cytosolic non-specific dipeptidase-like [Oppia nitens]|uniref:cytosolic non-specific dipeptidase-like n=1 Tax=Oppia nitens TaxID=1686743 RepID=UPI0023DA11E6|nr:cytosolic non-specific dipeptidase-like [Oppia nitens]